jgi:flagellar motor switch protein FliN/FliY
MTAFEEIAHLSDVPVRVGAELDRMLMTVRDLLALEPGSIIRLPRSAGDNIDIVIGGRVIGSGEIVIVEETIGVRITDFTEDE